MDPRFRKNHQLHLLLKKRTYVSDHELYEMMRSKRVFRAQNELRRELERTLQEIRLDQKARIASFMVQRATFIKMIAARKKSLRHLINVKKQMGEEYFDNIDEMVDDLGENGHDNDCVLNRQDMCQSFDKNNEDTFSSDPNNHLSETKAKDFAQSVNREWMEKFTNKHSEKTKTIKKERAADILKFKRSFDERNSTHKERILYSFDKDQSKRNDPVHKELLIERFDKPISKSETMIICDSVEDKYTVRKEADANKNLPNEMGERSLRKTMRTNPELIVQPEAISISLHEISHKNNTIPEKNKSMKTKNTMSHLSQKRLEPLLPTLNSQSKATLHVPTPIPNRPKPHERERSVTMLFIEESDDDEEDNLYQVSQFDIEAFLKHYKRKRGYSIVLSSTNLHQSSNEEQENESDVKNNNTRKKTMTVKLPRHQNPWGVKPEEDESPRRRSNQWYNKFLETKHSRKLHNKTMHQSHDSEHIGAVFPEITQSHKTDKGILWKTPSSSDSQLSSELLCELKLQRLKQHCQRLSERVALFVTT